jgi:hypothetical protein
MLFFLFLSLGCDSIVDTDPPTSSCNCPCPSPVSGPFGPKIPSTAYQKQKLSVDGETLAYIVNDGSSTVSLLDVGSLNLTTIVLREVLPDTTHWQVNVCTEVLWSPYDPNVIYLQCIGTFDTLGNGAIVSLKNGYTYNIVTHTATRVTPSVYGSYGSETGLSEFSVVDWLIGSQEGLDSLLTSSGIYVPQEDKFYPIPEGYREFVSQSPLGDIFYRKQFIQPWSSWAYYLSGPSPQPGLLWESKFIQQLTNISWTPTASRFALSVDYEMISNDTTRSNREVWVFTTWDVLLGQGRPERFTRLNLRDLFCTYSSYGIDAEFITDTTLAVSMHKDGDDTSELWEISITGRKIRQLTK